MCRVPLKIIAHSAVLLANFFKRIKEAMKKLCFINGSLRGRKASSRKFLDALDRRLDGTEYEKTIITVKAKTPSGYPEDDLRCLAGADVLVFVFPLFFYGLPAPLMRLLEDYFHYITKGNEYNRRAKVYVVINCGFFKPGINQEAVRVIKNFCQRLAIHWRFAVCIASGPLAAAMGKVPLLYLKLKRAYAAIVADIKSDYPTAKTDYLIKPILPKFVILAIKAHYERKMDYKHIQKEKTSA